MDKIQITLTTPVSSQEDQTPTPTKFLKQCEDIGLFNDLQRVNPFDETFKKAIDAQYSLLKYPLNVQNSEETLNTPTPFQIVEIDGNKINGLSEGLPSDKDHHDLSTKSINLVSKTSSTNRSLSHQSAVPNVDILSGDNYNAEIKSKFEIHPTPLRSPINDTCSVDSKQNICDEKVEVMIDIDKNKEILDNPKFVPTDVKNDITKDSSSFMPIKSKQINSTSESIKKFILNKKRNNRPNIIDDNINNSCRRNEPITVSENSQEVLNLVSRDTNQIYIHNIDSSPLEMVNQMEDPMKPDNEGLDSMVERLGALNSIKEYQSTPSKLLALLPTNGLKLTPIPSASELQITPIPALGSVKLPLPRKQDTPVPLVKKKTRELTKEEKRQQILERNRLAAKRSRERQKVQQHALELRLREKEKENKLLKLEIRNLKMKLLAKEQDIDQLAHIKAQEMLSRALGNT